MSCQNCGNENCLVNQLQAAGDDLQLVSNKNTIFEIFNTLALEIPDVGNSVRGRIFLRSSDIILTNLVAASKEQNMDRRCMLLNRIIDSEASHMRGITDVINQFDDADRTWFANAGFFLMAIILKYINNNTIPEEMRGRYFTLMQAIQGLALSSSEYMCNSIILVRMVSIIIGFSRCEHFGAANTFINTICGIAGAFSVRGLDMIHSVVSCTAFPENQAINVDALVLKTIVNMADFIMPFTNNKPNSDIQSILNMFQKIAQYEAGRQLAIDTTINIINDNRDADWINTFMTLAKRTFTGENFDNPIEFLQIENEIRAEIRARAQAETQALPAPHNDESESSDTKGKSEESS